MAHKILDFAHRVTVRAVRQGDHVVDATCGNGHDTIRLARAVGELGFVWGFDVQAEAIRQSRRRLVREGLTDRVVLVRDSHERLGDYVSEGVRVALFNLGYLPRAAHSITTRPDSTVAALRAAASHLVPGGRIIIVLYTGHDGGPEEKDAVDAWALQQARRGWTCVRFGFSGRAGAPPETLIVHAPDHSGDEIQPACA